MERLKQLIEWETLKVLGVSAASIASSAFVLDVILKTVISGLTIWWLWQKTHRKPNKEDEE